MQQKWLSLFFVLFTGISLSVSGQQYTIQSIPVSITNDSRQVIGTPMHSAQPAQASGTHNKVNIACTKDTVEYAQAKATTFRGLTLSNTTSASRYAQWYPAPQSLTISGFDFYGWAVVTNSQTVTLTCRLYDAAPDSTPLGAPRRTATITVDSTFGGGVLSALRKKVAFLPYTTSDPYVITVETNSATGVAVLANNWDATVPDGDQEWLSSAMFAGPNWVRGYDVTVGTTVLDADFLFHPYVNYNITANFLSSKSCIEDGDMVTFTNTSSSLYNSRFYSRYSYFGLDSFQFRWNYGNNPFNYTRFTGQQTYTQKGNYTVTLTYTLFGWRSNCIDTKSFTLYYEPDRPNATYTGAVCEGDQITLQTDSVGPFTYNWIGPNNFTFSDRDTVITNADPSLTGTYYLQVNNSGCLSPWDTLDVEIYPTPNLPNATNNGPLCVGQTLELSSDSVPFAIYAWTGPNGFVQMSRTATIPNADTLNAGTYYVFMNVNGCESPTDSTVVDIASNPGVPVASSNGPVCAGDTLQLSSSTIVDAEYSWTGPNGYWSKDQNPVVYNVNGSYTGDYYVSVSVTGCGVSDADTISVKISTLPANFKSNNTGPYCIGDTIQLSADDIPGAIYSWTGPNGFSASSRDGMILNANNTNAGNYTVSINLEGCATEPSATTNVLVTEPVALTINGPSTINRLMPASYSVVNTNGSVYNWTITGGTQTGGGNTSVIQVTWGSGTMGTVAVQEINQTGCEGVPVDLNVSLTNVGLTDLVKAGRLQGYPNPTTGEIQLEGLVDEPGQLTVYNMLGEVVQTVEASPTTGKLSIDLSSLTNGMYLLQWKTDQSTSAGRWVKRQ